MSIWVDQLPPGERVSTIAAERPGSRAGCSPYAHTYEETAAHLGLTPGAVKMIELRALAKLRVLKSVQALRDLLSDCRREPAVDRSQTLTTDWSRFSK